MLNLKTKTRDVLTKNGSAYSFFHQVKGSTTPSGDAANFNTDLAAPQPDATVETPPSKTNAPGMLAQDHESNLLWIGMALAFFALLFAYPIVMICQGNPHGVAYLIRLGSTLGVALVFAALAGMVHLLLPR